MASPQIKRSLSISKVLVQFFFNIERYGAFLRTRRSWRLIDIEFTEIFVNVTRSEKLGFSSKSEKLFKNKERYVININTGS